MKSFKGIHKGERCFVVGTGLSLRKTNLDLLVDEYTFGMHRIGMRFDKTIWRPYYYFCVTTRTRQSEYRRDVVCAIEQAEHSFIAERTRDYLEDDVWDAKGTWIKARYIGIALDHYNPKCYFTDIDNCEISVYGMSTFGCIQIADYMGFNPIYLVGMDLGYQAHGACGADRSHFHEDYERGFANPQFGMTDEEHLKAYRAVQESAPHLEIINCTVGGKLELFPRMTLEEVFDG